MNFLAHAYLSFGHPDILTGNMITDFIRGSQIKDFSPDIQNGVALHHAIDSFTDQHPATLEAREYLRAASGRYCVVFLDVVYDHFLAKDDNLLSLQELRIFSRKTYQILSDHTNILPERFQRLFHYMQKEDWLYNYHSKERIKKSFKGIYRRAVYLQESDAAYHAFNEHYSKLQEAYSKFMPEMIRYAKNFLIERGYPINSNLQT